ncbi:MAG: hypothetical protein MK207_05540 [Saprospiraceae bacterium]|nr:hypothetical protein [Saprospiraceae bacterium]
MTIINGLKEGLYQRKIKKCISHTKKRKATNLNNAKSIGLLFHASNDSDIQIVKKYRKELQRQHKKVTWLGYKNIKTLNGNEEFPCFCNKDLGLSMTPKKASVKQFINQKFDILISLHTKECLPLEYISAASSAYFRIGHYQENKVASYDFMVYGKTKSLRAYIQQMETYLKKIY